MNTNHPSFTDQFEQFGEAQLAEVSTHDIHGSTTHLILSTVFFTGAAISLARQTKTPKKVYLAALCRFMENHFGINNEKAAGMIESNARLCKRYVLVENVYKMGWEVTIDWKPENENDQLKSLLKKYHDLSMSELGIEGTREQEAEPKKVHKITPTAPVSESVLAVPPSRWKRKMLALIIFILIGGVAYATFFPEQSSALAAILKPTLEHVSKSFSALPLDELLNKVRSLIP